MEKKSEITRLEKYVERLLEGYTSLGVEKKHLEQDLQEQRLENDRLQQQLKTMDLERGEVSGRVSSLIGRIEQWESELEVDSAVGEPDTTEPSEQPVESEEMTMLSEEKVELQDEENSGGVQGSLFNNQSSTG